MKWIRLSFFLRVNGKQLKRKYEVAAELRDKTWSDVVKIVKVETRV